MQSAYVVHASQDEKEIISALMTPYLTELGQSGEYEYLPCYWREPESRFPYLIKIVDAVAGFALVRKTRVFEMAEFYVAPPFRRQRTGQSAVEQLLQRHPGEWTLSIARSNHAGQAFWTEALQSSLRTRSVVSANGNCLAIQFST